MSTSKAHASQGEMVVSAPCSAVSATARRPRQCSRARRFR